MASGKTLEQLQRKFRQRPVPFAGMEKRVCCLEREPEDLRARVARRVEAMMEAGLVAEVQALLAAGIERNPSAAGAIGYRETICFLKRGGSLAELKAEIAQNTLRLIRKQRTWRRRQIPVDQRLLLRAGEAGDSGQLFC